jgi:predicted RNA-binding Zn ribbon-like protein
MTPTVEKTERPPAFFISNDAALDFLNSHAGPWGTKIDWIADGKDLVQWLTMAGLLPEANVTELLSPGLPGQLDLVAAEARVLREWFRAFVAEHRGKPLTAKAVRALQPLNDLLARDDSYLALEARSPKSESGTKAAGTTGGPLELIRRRRWQNPSALLLPIAEAMARLVATADFTHVKKCENEPCTFLMLDNSRRHDRRWCCMGLCGNRVKQSVHRVRQNA